MYLHPVLTITHFEPLFSYLHPAIVLYFRKILFKGWAQTGKALRELLDSILITLINADNAVDTIGLFPLTIIRQIIQYNRSDQQASRKANRKPGDIDERIHFVSLQVP